MLVKYFIPHESNDHRPHALRTKTAAFLAGAIFVVEVLFVFQGSFLAPVSKLFGLVLSNVLIDQTNEKRIEMTLPALRVSPVLEQAAREKAEDMAKKGYFAHTSPEGLKPWYWFQKNGYAFTYAGENLAVNFLDSRDVTEAWMNCWFNRENFLNGIYAEMGIGPAPAIYQGRETLFVVQLFGKPAAAKSAVVHPPSSASPPLPAPVPIGNSQTTTTLPAPVPLPAPFVIGESSSTGNDVEEIFVAIQGAESEADVEHLQSGSTPSFPAVIPAANAAQRIVASPKTVVNSLYFLIAGILGIALLLLIFVKIRIQHPGLIANGVLLLLIISGALFLNQYLALYKSSVLSASIF